MEGQRLITKTDEDALADAVWHLQHGDDLVHDASERVTVEETRLAALGIEWHCPGRHGVVRNVVWAEEGESVSATLEYFFGCRGGHGLWWKKDAGGTYDGEFVHMCKVFPPPKKPWEWCGLSVLFADWQAAESAERSRLREFKIGDEVAFTHKGETLTGIVVNKKKRLTVLIGHQKWYVPVSSVAATGQSSG